MKNHLIGTSAKLADLKPGDSFVFEHRDGAKYIGLAIEGERPETGPDVAVIYPSHPSLDGAPGIFSHSVLRNKALLKLRDAEIVPSAGLDDIQCGYDDFNPPAGLLFQLEGELVLLCSNGEYEKKRYINTSTGRYADISDTQNYVYFDAWKIVLPDENGKKIELAKFSMKKK